MQINLYNFAEEEPSATVYDVTSCYNETLSKTFILSFPGEMNPFMQESTTFLKQKIQLALREIANVSQLRISVQEVTFRSSYLYAQFKIVDLLSETQSSETQSTLAEAVSNIRKAVSEGKLEINFRTRDNLIISLKPDPFGLKEYAKEEEPPVVHQGFTQGSVGGLAFGMILLGFVMGGAVVNLFISRKHGVSLFQKAGFGNSESSFNNPLNESPI